MNDTIAFVFCIVPILGFASAGMLEYQRDHQSLRTLVRGVPLGFAVALSVLLLIDIWHPYFSFRGLSIWIAGLTLLVPVSAVACGYKSRVAAALIFLAGLLLAFFWYVNRIVA